jgi:hypothetical protein
MIDGSWRTGLTREQKMGAGFLLIFGVLTIALGWLQLHNTLYGPFVIKPTEDNKKAVAYTDEKTKLQQIDTDHDGISDYDELYFYKTSPYLPDTDSDGIGDKVEIDRGSDPLCVEGQVCNTDSSSDNINQASSTVSAESLIPDSPTPIDVLQSVANQNSVNTQASGGFTKAELDAVAKDPKALRQLLLQSGQVSQAELQKIDDATLLSVAAQIVASQTVNNQ